MTDIDQHIQNLRKDYPDMTDAEEKMLREQYPTTFFRNVFVDQQTTGIRIMPPFSEQIAHADTIYVCEGCGNTSVPEPEYTTAEGLRVVSCGSACGRCIGPDGRLRNMTRFVRG